MQYNYEPLKAPVTKRDIVNYKNQFSNVNRKYSVIQLVVIGFGLSLFMIPLFMMFIGTMLSLILSGNILNAFGIVLFTASVVGLFWGLLYFAINQRYKYEVKLFRFAQGNNLMYEPESFGANLNYPGMIFNVGHSRRYMSRLRSSSGSFFEISNFAYTIGSGKDSRTVENGYIMIKLDRNLPNIVLDSNKNNFKLLGMNISNLPVNYKDNQKLSLEGDFDKYFTLYVPAGYERDALYVFTPDLMALFIDNSSVYDAEVVDDKLFIYSNGFDITNPDVLERLFKIIDTVGQKTLSQTENYSDARVGVGSVDSVSTGGARLKKRILPVGIIIFLVIYFLISIIGGTR